MCLQSIERVWGVKARLWPRGTCYSPADSAQSLSPCLSLFVERLIKARSVLGGFTASGSFWADAHGRPIMFPRQVPRDMKVHTFPLACVWANLSVSSLEHLHFNPEGLILCTYEDTWVWRVKLSDDYVFEASECANGLQPSSVIRMAGSNSAAQPVISDENHRIKGFSLALTAYVSLLNPRRPRIASAPSTPLWKCRETVKGS